MLQEEWLLESGVDTSYTHQFHTDSTLSMWTVKTMKSPVHLLRRRLTARITPTACDAPGAGSRVTPPVANRAGGRVEVATRGALGLGLSHYRARKPFACL